VIEPRRDAYGPEADTGNLADYLELLALARTPLRRAELADYLAEERWVVRSRELFHDLDPEEDSPGEDQQDGGAGPLPADVAAADVFELLQFRADQLQEHYPFELVGNQLCLREPLEDNQKPYLSLLAITVAHHYSVETSLHPERVFESLVASVMRTRGLTSVDTGEVGRGTGDFRALVRNVAERLELIAAPDAASSRAAANEEGVDTVSHLSWGDVRPGHWVFIGQATCAQSNEWARKVLEPKPPQWGPLLSCVVKPLAYLAVPHHVESAHLLYISNSSERLVLDRLRLARQSRDLSDDELTLLEEVTGAAVHHPLE